MFLNSQDYSGHHYENSPSRSFYSLLILLEKLNIKVQYTAMWEDDEYIKRVSLKMQEMG